MRPEEGASASHSSLEPAATEWSALEAEFTETPRISHEPLLEDLSVLRNCAAVLVIGGTFDPFTRAHLEVPHAVADALGADALLYVPARRNPLKEQHAAASNEDRLEMI